MDFINEYFVEPILANGWFNPVNSIVYGLILVIAVYFVYKMLKKMRIKIDRYFAFALLPFIFWGAVTRVLHDAAYYGVLKGRLGEFFSLPIFPTPGSYFITFSLALLILFLSLLIQKYTKFVYWKTMIFMGVLLDIINVFLLPRIDFFPMFIILSIALLWTLLFFLLYKFSQKTKYFIKNIFSAENSCLLSAHMLDASATFVALSFFGYAEQHPLPRFLIELTNPAVMFLLKLIVLLPVLYLIDRYSEEGDFKNFLKIVILILGLAPGLRDMIRLMVGV
ncbi:MAG: DUF63 family protein [Candidatus Aenigmatarchaeota archaeon]